ncbi:hypothetical protein SAMD00019534_096730 [Acytostelium subglobosum LB1]|uniref:hypothetical protein n=1 Tax=Acytostelium subglobosum LB1 TaxID=1410327 RepID=UPI000644FCD1|nr:hypothetical protein SAMD00019534_096730 [Acytostelium subglobosum LB1]GAM26498.1 hypothetical protein SAMD00019534_096730 [Acytostelium subglobosum LB1]|eukprot:XP_012750594.1 hypothetical protein SAMD00019534_096730 [Acytostelium subglobosum LB1]
MSQQSIPTTFDQFLASPFERTVALLRPNKEIKQYINFQVAKVTNLINSQLTPARVVKGGSNGKGTNLIDRMEVDLVVLFNDLAPTEAAITDKVNKLADCLKKGLNIQNVEPGIYYEHKSQRDQVITRIRSVKLEYKGIKFDVLPAPLLKNGFMSFTTMDPKTEIPFASAAASPLQVEFIKQQPANYKDLVRLVKCWRNLSDWKWDKSTTPSSYLIELVTLKVFEDMMTTSKSLVVEAAFAKVLGLLAQPTIEVYWPQFYVKTWKNAAQSHQGRLVVDPANPTNNVAEAVTDWKWTVEYSNFTLKRLVEPTSSTPSKDGSESWLYTIAMENNDMKKKLESTLAKVDVQNQTITAQAKLITDLTTRLDAQAKITTDLTTRCTWMENYLAASRPAVCETSFNGMPNTIPKAYSEFTMDAVFSNKKSCIMDGILCSATLGSQVDKDGQCPLTVWVEKPRRIKMVYKPSGIYYECKEAVGPSLVIRFKLEMSYHNNYGSFAITFIK